MNSAASVLINGAIVSVPLTAVVWLALRLTPRRALNASTRYVIWRVALAAALALPALFLDARQAPAPHPSGSGNLRITVLNLEQQPAARAGSFHLPLSVPIRPWLRWLAIVWLFTSAVLLLRLLLSHLAVLRACVRAAGIPLEWRSRIEPWRAVAGSRRDSVRIAASAEIPVPFAAGPFRPAIVIPTRLFDRLSGEDLDRIGLHEAAHLARRDDCAILAERLLIAIFPWHLVARWIANQIDVEREIACDDRVVEVTGCPRRYAECLTRVVELCGGVRGPLATASMASHGTHLSQRVELLIDRPRHPRPRLLPAPVLPFAAGLLALVLVSAHAPRLVAFTAPMSQEERTMTSKTVKKLGRKLAVAAAATAALAAPTASAQTTTPAPQAQVQPASAGRNIACLIDTGGLSPADVLRATDAATKFVQVQMRRDDKLALMISTDRGLQVRQDFTSDSDVLTRALQHLADERDSFVAEVPRTPDHLLALLGTTVKMLGPVTGKKALIYFTSVEVAPSRAQIEALVDDATRADVAFYFVDVRSPIGK